MSAKGTHSRLPNNDEEEDVQTEISEDLESNSTVSQFEIEKLYINPEPDVTFDDVNKPGMVKKEGPLLCTSKPGGTDKSLEF